MRALLTGGDGMLASSIIEAWRAARSDDELVVLRRTDVDLRDASATRRIVASAEPDLVIHTAAYVGGIGDKLSRPLPYLLNNVQIDSSLLAAVVAEDVPGFVYVASAAAYPAGADNPISEEALFQGPLEPANEGYGLAKLTGLTAVTYAARQTGQAYRVLVPSNLYGPRDSFDPSRAHLIASTLRKTHEARASGAGVVDVWGDGTARREFTYGPDLADWLVRDLDHIASWPVVMNVGAGTDHSIREYYEIASEIVGFDGSLEFDTSQPSGVARRLIDSGLARGHGWNPTTTIHAGMRACYRAFIARTANGDI